uniref:Sushi domain-containing protein n=1 Tax=Heligmosomoides polygyrus TaxID=6339 RepID=A0A8L8JYQ9_HELPZ
LDIIGQVYCFTGAPHTITCLLREQFINWYIKYKRSENYPAFRELVVMYRLFLALGFLTFINAAGQRCRFTDVERDKGYTGMLLKGRLRKTAGNGRTVELICGRGNHNYTCESGVLKESSPRQARCGCKGILEMLFDMPKEERPSPMYDSVTYDPTPNTPTTVGKDGIWNGVDYRNGSTVKPYCDTGPVINGSSKAVCVSGKWVPTLGVCPKMCSIGSLKENGKFVDVTATTKGDELNPPPREQTLIPIVRKVDKDKVQHGVKVVALCKAEDSTTAAEGVQEFECDNGKWKPEPVPCP